MIFLVINLYSQELQKFEPPDGRVIHGLGQHTVFFYSEDSIWQDVKDYESTVDNIPVIYSVYASIDSFNNKFDSTDFNEIRSNHDYPYLLVVGISLHDSLYLTKGIFNVHVESIINGSLDKEIIKLAIRIKNINAPVFLRPGFEFGINNNGVHSDEDLDGTEFKNIWIHIYNIFSELQVTNVAWVWNTVNPSNFDYMEWYPGDAYVDWWGINYFTLDQINESDNFLNDARLHNKPVIICESSPILFNGTLNSDNWNNWFVPFFDKIITDNQIKAFVYTNSPWTQGPWSHWPDSRIAVNPVISEHYKDTLNDTVFINMDEYLSNPDIIAPITSDLEDLQPEEFILNLKNHPNPFNNNTTLTWVSNSLNPVVISIFNILGAKIKSSIIHDIHFGKNKFVWDTTEIPSGIYFAQISLLNSKSKINTSIKMTLIK